ncbi:MAG: glycoside hydrolase family 99-like domain-containing protein [Thermoanaerobaculia bacterium]
MTSDSPPRRRALIVLGMHRSGTSALTRVFSLCGAGLPSNLVPPEFGLPADGNSISGFWESTSLLLLNNEALESAGSDWDSTREIPQDWFESENCHNITLRLSEALENEFGNAPIFVAKDPRTSLLVPMWIAALDAIGVTADWIVAVRNPLEVAASLTRRDGFARSKGLDLWLRHSIAAERATRKVERIFVDYDDLMRDWRFVVTRTEIRFSFKFPHRVETIAKEAEKFLNRDLRHHSSSMSEMDERPDVPREAKETFRWMLRASAGYEGETTRLDEIYRSIVRGAAASEVPADALAPEGCVAPGEHQAATAAVGQEGGAEVTSASRVKPIAFYLPQFHPTPENDAWWGTGFTEWTNVTRAEPCFRGHQQPLLPSELGFYDLRLAEVRIRQAELAREHGIHGFCYYYYWFHGKKLLSRPLESMLLEREPDFPFCICWANENWTRRWDGENDSILLAQEHTPESDARFIDDVMPVLLDPRYIRIDGKPLVLVYRADLMADPARTAARWREAAREAGLPGLHLCVVWRVDDPTAIGFDALVEFPPHHFHHKDITNETRDSKTPFQGRVYDYAAGVAAVKPLAEERFPVYRGVMPSWDNTPRRGLNAHVFARSTPAIYGRWLETVVRESAARPGSGDQFVFINAWNEWAEGATLEPSRAYGRAYLEATREALLRSNFASPPLPNEPSSDLVELPEPHVQNAPPRDEAQTPAPPAAAGGSTPVAAPPQDPAYWSNAVWGVKALVTKGPLWLVTGRLSSRLRWWRQMRSIVRSGLFDADYYRTVSCPDIGKLRIDPLYHFVRYGAEEELDPNPAFSVSRYLDLHPELDPSVENPLVHSLDSTSHDGATRRELWLNARYGLLPFLVKAPAWLVLGRLETRGRWWREMRELVKSGRFDAHAYRRAYPEVAARGVDPLYHYVRYGAAEGRLPQPAESWEARTREHPVLMSPTTSAPPRRPDSIPTRIDPVGPSAAEPLPTAHMSRGKSGRGVKWVLNAAHLKSRDHNSRPILIVSHDAARAGAQLLLLEVIKRLASLPDLETFVLFLGRGELEDDFRRVVHTLQIDDVIEGLCVRREVAISQIVSGFAARSPLLALCNTVVSHYAAAACSESGIPVLSLIHELPTSIDSTIGSCAMVDVAAASRSIVVVSDFVKAALLSRYSLPPERLSVLRPSVFDWDDGDGWRSRCRSRVLKELGIPDSSFIVLGCGMVHQRKGPDLFVQAARDAIAMRGSERMVFIWVGPDQSGPLLREWCEHDIRSASLERRIRFLGGRTATGDYFGAADAFALTSREDPFPLVNLEAMARGVPVVAFRSAGGAPEALADGGGIVVPYLDTHEMARSLVRLSEAPNYHKEVSAAAARTIELRHTWDHYMSGLLAIFNSEFGYAMRRAR